MEPYSILFLSSAEISSPLLKVFCNDSRFRVIGVICQPDKPAGRTMEMCSPLTKIVAQKLNLEVFQPVKLSLDEELLNRFEKDRPDFLITFAYGQLLSEAWLSLPKKFALNVHASLLPKYRGASPIQTAILNGEQKTGLSLMKMAKEMDAGPVAFVHDFTILPHMTANLLTEELADLASKTIPEDLILLANSPENLFKEQDASLATFTKKIVREDGEIDFKKSADEILRMFRAFIPWPGVYSFFKGKRLKFTDLERADEVLSPGEVCVREKKVYIGTSDGSLLVKQLQMDGKNQMYTEQFLLGYADFAKSVLPS
ncbi:MAG: methionyl-tRNA formyltransferase [Candidatus Gracilibacteria bacterium]